MEELKISDLRYAESTTKSNKFVIFSDSKSALQALWSKWDHPIVQPVMLFLVFIHTVQNTVLFCWLPSHLRITGHE